MQTTVFEFEWPHGGSSVDIAGSFNHWQKIPMMYSNSNKWTAHVDLAPGIYQYKFIIDGCRWHYDIIKETVDDTFGGKNNLILVPKSNCPNWRWWLENHVSEDFVYKSCGDWIVIMKKLPCTIDNESRSDVVDKLYAKFRANTLHVVAIVNKFNYDNTINSIQNTNYTKFITYVVGETISILDYDLNLNQICSAGIHYFRSHLAAYYYELSPSKLSDNDKQLCWYDNGQKKLEKNYLDGKIIIPYLQWFDNGQKRLEKNYLDKMIIGTYLEWFDNGQKKLEKNYWDGKLSGWYSEWFCDGHKYLEGSYLNGHPTGLWTRYFDNGQKSMEENYLEGELTGPYLTWYDNGQKRSEENYLNGKRAGLHTKYFDDGRKKYEKMYSNDELV